MNKKNLALVDAGFFIFHLSIELTKKDQSFTLLIHLKKVDRQQQNQNLQELQYQQ
jgi:hypothetical protein